MYSQMLLIPLHKFQNTTTMQTLTVTKEVTTGIGVTLTSCMASLIEHTLRDLVVWLVVILCLLLADMLSKWYEIFCCHTDAFRFSKGVRVTLIKATAYFAAIIAFIFYGYALDSENAKYVTCSIICIAEVASIIKHILRVKGYSVSELTILKWFLSKKELPEDALEPINSQTNEKED